MKITAADRLAAQTPNPSVRMSEASKAKLKATAEHEKLDRAETIRVMAEFAKLRKDVPNYTHALRTICTMAPVIRDGEVLLTADELAHRMGEKLLAYVMAGYQPITVGGITFLATLTPDEERLTDAQFAAGLGSVVPARRPKPEPTQKKARKSPKRRRKARAKAQKLASTARPLRNVANSRPVQNFAPTTC